MPTCKQCHDKFISKYFLQKYCMVHDECIKAFSNWVSEQNKKKIDKAMKQEKQVEDKKWKGIKIVVHTKKYKNQLQMEVNKLARMIDLKFGYNTCIDCGKPFGSQQDGGHFKSVGANNSLRYNLDDIHSQKSDCNRNGMGSGRILDYYRGLIKRYGQEYADYVDSGLQLKYKSTYLSEVEVYEKLTLVRLLVKNFDTFELTSSLQARNLFNNLIGIYK